MTQNAETAVVPVSNGKRLLNELLESSRSLPYRDSDLGSIQLGINELRKRAHELRKNTIEIKSEENYTKAHYLLAGKVSIDEVASNIKSLENNNVLEPRSKINTQQADLDSYLRTKKDENILSAIEQSLSATARDFDNFVNQNISLDWKQRRDEIRESFGIVLNKQASHTDSKSQNGNGNKSISWGKSFKLSEDNTSKLNVNANYSTRRKFERYAKVVNELNNSRQFTKTLENADSEFDLANEFIQIYQNGSDSKSRQLYESWQIIANVNKGNFKSTNEKSFKNQVVARSRTFLELQFFEYADAIYKKKVTEKGLPTIINKIKSFIDSQKLNANGNLLVVNGTPIWALIFYLLRAGCQEEALNLVLEHQSVFKKVEQSFVPYFKAYVSSQDKRLPQPLVTKIQNEFNHHIKNSIDGDPYRYAVYKILGRCQLSRRNISNIALTIEDWLWMHLMLIREDSQVDYDPIHEKYTLSDFQEIILSYGNNKFSSNYLQVLLLSGLYDEAGKYALETDEMDGVHLNIGLAAYGLLQKSTQETVNKTKGARFSKLLGSYVESFKFSDPRIAVEYLILICLFPDQIETCHEALRELVLETREFAILLGKINAAGVRVPGKIEQRKSLINLENDFLNKITEQAAITADKEGRIYDGLLLYQLSEEYEIVISIVNRLLGEFLSNTELEQSLVDGNSETNPILIAENFLSLYQDISVKNKEICKSLLKIAEIRQYYLEKDWDTTLKKIEELEILPINPNSDLGTTRLKAEELTFLNENVLKNVPNLLIITMTCVAQKNEQINSGPFNGGIKDDKLKELRLVAKNCVIFAGMVQYKMPRETFSLLIGLEALL
ncbi:Nucleoporin [Wickerhamomyces ciferrii]|uniref:Nuclear pore protein n=1 Tax=Wickerhamomyces ciferrii (strain ATCC 14091 / BCRC 22168 / CBS 111 / JCM 3599 / NBRC 0793 / NRRL Y-1031 F-60-10) TaxID=1206466 RepID=K0KFU0_WICCF|nr:Nucleoporin [Wickerhamomyces ciferrii]CCH41761.1 Nucleoporin [Wickerhamomyces ciferrii]